MVDVNAVAYACSRVSGKIQVYHRNAGKILLVLVHFNYIYQRITGYTLQVICKKACNAGFHKIINILFLKEFNKLVLTSVSIDRTQLYKFLDKLVLYLCICQSFCNLIFIVDNLDSVVLQKLCKLIMFLLCNLQKRNIIKKQFLEVHWSQLLQLSARSVKQNLVQLTDFREIVNTFVHR